MEIRSSGSGTILALSWLSASYIRDEMYSKALARLVNHQHRQPFAAHWGEGTTSSSDGQQFRAGRRGGQAGQSIFVTAPNLECSSIPMYPTSKRRFTPTATSI